MAKSCALLIVAGCGAAWLQVDLGVVSMLNPGAQASVLSRGLIKGCEPTSGSVLSAQAIRDDASGQACNQPSMYTGVGLGCK